MSNQRISTEAWFAIGGLILGIAFLLYRGPIHSSVGPNSLSPGRDRPLITEQDESQPSVGTPVTLGIPVTINEASSPLVRTPESDPLLPLTSPQVDAVLALKYYLLSDAVPQALELFEAVPKDSQDIVVRSALYAVWDRGEHGKGDWFMGSTVDPYTSRVSALKLVSDPLHNTDSVDAMSSEQRVKLEQQLATQRIELASQLLQKVDARTRAYWVPYLVVKLRRLYVHEHQSLIDALVKQGNDAIADSLKSYKIETQSQYSWSFATKAFSVTFPVVLSALAFVMAKISQSTLAAVDRWIGKYWLKTEESVKKTGEEPKA